MVAATALVRECRGLEASLDRIEAIYSEMLAAAPASDAAAEAAAVGAFIAGWVPHFGQQAPWRRVADQVAHPPLGSPIDVLTRGHTMLAQKVDILAQKVDGSAGTQVDALKVVAQNIGAVAQNIDALAGAQADALKDVACKIDALAATQSAALEAMRPEAVLRGLWRRTVPVQLREPLHRVRQRLRAALQRSS